MRLKGQRVVVRVEGALGVLDLEKSRMQAEGTKSFLSPNLAFDSGLDPVFP